MPSNHRGNVLEFLRAVRPVAGPTDGELLGRFVARGDGPAFAELLRRHGPMVLSTCRRLLRHEQDAEDAFQATFLVLARKAASVVPREAVGGWLYGVACRTAQAARGRRRRREAREKQMGELPERAAPPALDRVWDELVPLLDRELGRLPEKYRLAVVLCELEGRPRREVARQLGIPEGTLSSRLATARKLLARRLGQGVGALAVALAQGATRAEVPALLAVSTVEAASRFAAGQAVAGAVRPGAAALTEGVMKAMFIGKLKVVSAVVLAVLLVVGVGALGPVLAGDGPVSPGAGSAGAGGSTPGTLPPGAPPGDTVPPGAQPGGDRGPAPGGGIAPPGLPGGGGAGAGLPGRRATDPTKAKPDPERRLAEMEKQLRQLQKKVEALEKELRDLRGKPGGGGAGPSPTTPGGGTDNAPGAPGGGAGSAPGGGGRPGGAPGGAPSAPGGGTGPGGAPGAPGGTGGTGASPPGR
jgi:RNA polymerase sigma factor (sigma-70 family)